MTAKPPKKCFLFCLIFAVLLYALAYYLGAAHPLTDRSAAALDEWQHWSRIVSGLQITSLILLIISNLWILIASIKSESDND